MQKIICTHSGAFHCDQALACLLLTRYSKLFKGASIVRSRDPKVWESSDILVDVGSKHQPPKYFDHHQKEFTLTRVDEVRLSSAGLIYWHFDQIVPTLLQEVHGGRTDFPMPKEFSKIRENLYNKFIKGIDANDNGDQRIKPTLPLNHALWDRVARLNTDWFQQFNQENQLKAFYKAMQLVGEQLRDQAKGELSKFWSQDLIRRAYLSKQRYHASGQIIYLQKVVPWKQAIYLLQKQFKQEGKSIYVIYYNQIEKDHRVQAVPQSQHSFNSRRPLWADLRGKSKEELVKISGILDIVFVHNSGFIGGAKSLESAIKLAEISLSK